MANPKLDETTFLKKRPPKGETKISGARFMAETFKGYGLTHVFFLEAILRKTLQEYGLLK
jgi:hypothetical protein